MEHENEGEVIKLDGSLGVGDHCLFTLITKDPVEGEKEETFQFPLSLINLPVAEKFVQMNFLLGYKIVRQPKVQAQ
jgi:hypothetical protein